MLFCGFLWLLNLSSKRYKQSKGKPYKPQTNHNKHIADPDVVVVGELRDPESMGAALSIAETGHLVLATMHTNTAAGAITHRPSCLPMYYGTRFNWNLFATSSQSRDSVFKTACI